MAANCNTKGARVVVAERRHILGNWDAATRGPINKRALAGLALSGGGIRSASFAFGVMQALAACKADNIEAAHGHPSILQRLQYISTVSGGGFAGTALTRLVNILCTPFDLGENFPFREGASEAGRGAKPGTQLGVIRHKASYLDSQAGSGKLSAVTVAARSIILTFFVYLLGAATVIGALYPFLLGPRIESLPILGVEPNGALLLSLAFGLCLVLSWLVYSLSSGVNPDKHLDWAGRLNTERYGSDLAFYALMTAALSVVGLLPPFKSTGGQTGLVDGILSYGSLGALGALGAAGAFVAQFKTLLGGFSDRRWLPAIFIWASGLGLIAALLIGGREIALAWFDPAAYETVLRSQWYWYWIASLGAAFLLVGRFGNVNYVGLHRFYRDRLMLTFLDNEVVPKGCTPVDTLKLDHVLDVSRGLYPLVNANVVLVNSDNPKFKGRGGDSFVLSPLYMGSCATGWAPTAVASTGAGVNGRRGLRALCQRGLGRVRDRLGLGISTISLASAMAVSGAALNPSAGLNGEGPTRSGMLPIILSLLGIRLGYWLPNPRYIAMGGRSITKPDYLVPGLWHGILQQGHTEDANWLEITDGGHFENMGLYELFRRKVRLIIVADGSTDPDFSMSGFASAYERARNDFGVEIDIASYPANFNDMMPDSARPNSSIKRRYRLAEHGFAIGVFTYPEDRKSGGEPSRVGYIFYVNTVLTENLKSNLYSYKAEHPQFPDEPLSDQFFNEKQFDAYCQLGRELTEQMLDYARGYAELADALGLSRKPNFKYWGKVKEAPTDSPEQFLGAKLDGLREAIHSAKV